MSPRATLALPLAIASGVALGGCFVSHELDAPPMGRDASLAVDGGARDAGAIATIDASRDGGACVPASTGVTVRVEPITAERARCEVGHAESIVISAIDPEPGGDGIRMHADLCPGADADCRCDIVVLGVGSDLAARIPPRSGLTLDVGPSTVTLRQIPTCDCVACPCSLQLVFSAGDEVLIGPGPPDVRLSQGEPLCAAPSACESGTFLLRADALGETAQVAAGTEQAIGFVSVRSVRDVDIFAPCAACGTCGSPRGAWAAWVSP